MKTVLQSKDNATYPVLYMAMELSNKKWKLAFGDGMTMSGPRYAFPSKAFRGVVPS